MLAISCFTNPGDLVLDPYSGSGTTAIAAAVCDRVGIGTEMNREYARLSLGMAREQGLKVLLLKRSQNGDFIKDDFILAGVAISVKKQATLDAFGKKDSIPNRAIKN